jgi:uncharacterized protein (TIGR03435 family)
MTFADLSPWANHLWQSTLFAAVAWLLTLALRKNRAAVRYWIWLAASAKFLIPFSLLVSAGAQLGWRTAPAVAQPRFSFVMEEIAQPFALSAPTPLPAATAPTLNPLPAILFGVWLCGVAMGAIFWLRWWRRIRAIQRAATPLPLNLPIRVMSSTARLEPGVVGIVRPVLLLPEGIAEHLTPPQLEAILAHELRHVQRRDNLTAAIHMVVETLFWFHPLVWWIRGRLVEERELACDEGVLRLGSEPQVYAESILKVCEFYLASPVACAAGVTGGELKKRIEAIMSNRSALRLNFARKMMLVTAGLTALAAPLVVGISNAPAIRAQSAQTRPGRGLRPPAFEVASIKLNPDCVIGDGRSSQSPVSFNLPCLPLRGLLRMAYSAQVGAVFPSRRLEVLGGPDWLDTDRYIISAKAAGAASPAEMVGPMLQALLEERFKVKVHKESRDAPVYELTVAKNSPKLQPTKDGSCTPMDLNNLPRNVKRGDAMPKYCGGGGERSNGVSLISDWYGVSMAELAGRMVSSHVDRPVIDKTGLTGRFDVHLEFTPDNAISGAGTVRLNGVDRPDLPGPSTDPTGPSIFTALQEQLGLKLSPARGSLEVIVIDHAERPSAD